MSETPGVAADVVRSRWVTREQVLVEIDAAGRAFVELLAGLPAAASAQPVPHLDWTVGETAAHVVNVVRRGLGDRRRALTPDGLAELNTTGIGEVAERDLMRLAEALVADLATLQAMAPGAPADAVAKLHAGVRADLPSAMSYILTDLDVHGYDIATAAGRPWRYDPRRATLTLLALLPATRPWLRPAALDGPRAAVALLFDDAAEPLAAEVGGGAFAVSRVVPAGVDVVAADPVDTMLAMTGRITSGNPGVATLAGWYAPL